MPTRYVNTASSAGGDGTTNATSGDNRAYVSLNAAEAALPADITTGGDQGIWTIICEGSADDTTAVTFSGTTTSSSYYIDAKAVSTATYGRHDGKWNTNKYILYVAGGTYAISSNIGYLYLTGLQIDWHTDIGDAILLNGSSGSSVNNTVIEACIIRSYYETGNGITCTSYFDSLVVRNSVIWKSAATRGTSTEGIFLDVSGTTVAVDNCVVCGFNDGIEQDAGTITVRNSAVFNNDDDFDAVLSISYCASDDGDGTNAVNISPGATEATDWASCFVDYPNGDFHLKAGSVCIGAGTDLSGTFTLDIDGETRSSWDIGADEYPAAASSVTLFLYHYMHH